MANQSPVVQAQTLIDEGRRLFAHDVDALLDKIADAVNHLNDAERQEALRLIHAWVLERFDARIGLTAEDPRD